MSNHLTPEKRFDKNGRLVTRHVRADENAKRISPVPTLASMGNNSHQMDTEVRAIIDLALPVSEDGLVRNIHGEDMDPSVRDIYLMVLSNCPPEVTASLFNAAQKYPSAEDQAIIAAMVYRIKNTTGTRKLVAKMMATHVETLIETRDDTIDSELIERYESTVHDAMSNRILGSDMDLDMQVDARIIVSLVLPSEEKNSSDFLQGVLEHRSLITKHKQKIRERGFIDFDLLVEMDRTSNSISSGAL